MTLYLVSYNILNIYYFFLSEIQCPEDLGIKDGNLTYEVSSTAIGTTVTFSCPDNMNMTGGQPNITCNSSGLWDGDIPQCLGRL